MIKQNIPEGVLIVEDFLEQKTISQLKYFADGEIGIINKEDIKRADGSLAVIQTEGMKSERIYTQKIQKTAYAYVTGFLARLFRSIMASRLSGTKILTSSAIEKVDSMSRMQTQMHARMRNQNGSAMLTGISVQYSISTRDTRAAGLSFPDHNCRISPKPGMLVAFPSNHHYIHTAEPVLSGIRYAFVTWAAARGSERIFENPRGEIVYLNRSP